jgi:hypothetical protein
MKKTVDEKLDNVFDIVPSVVADQNATVVTHQETTPLNQLAEDGNIDADYEYARGNLKGLIENGKIAMENIIFLAKEGESPRAYEVVGQLIKTLAETNKDLLELGKKAKEARGKEKESAPQHVTNALFVGSTAELQKMLKGK